MRQPNELCWLHYRTSLLTSICRYQSDISDYPDRQRKPSGIQQSCLVKFRMTVTVARPSALLHLPDLIFHAEPFHIGGDGEMVAHWI